MSLSTLASLGMAVGAPLVYADQAYSIYRKQDATGFSHDVCAVLLIANITRCFFWLGEHFEFALLLQSILMIASQLGLLYLCLRFKPITASSRSLSSSGSRVIFQSRTSVDEDSTDDPLAFTTPTPASRPAGQQQSASRNEDGDEDEDDDGISYPDKKPLLASLGLGGWNVPLLGRSTSRYGVVSGSNEDAISSENHRAEPGRDVQVDGSASSASGQATRKRSAAGRGRPLNFWQWEDYGSYLLFLSLLTILLAILQVALGWMKGYVATLGFIALGLESTLPIPQLIANQKRRSLAGFRTSVLVGWLGGDSFKLVYFLLRSSPLQFTVCALFQLSIDGLILLQSVVFLEKTKRDEEELKQRDELRRAARGDVDFVDVESLAVRGAGAGGGGGGGGGGRGAQEGHDEYAGQTVEADDDDDDDDGQAGGDLGKLVVRP
ncbi:uncharacterized protein PFL1_04893 [Pseudozyma flocculosa PF-1]|uniref:PQ loop repeat protein n=2 Tax=Pseudozyma flocculosa TaxID=84751 RepID=A0A5C3F454_9BASI|nr:uncharacterized protein PFL1_04893 [Pseudozyma flocculosa PF-1]EPQ27756.1 hypothetical protein PFL1_04893 [Pseudozyma flocculosa PF-1]SPO39102.1 uncharacterized protein PSFLO_04581 [Pseudozyma flocculosa]